METRVADRNDLPALAALHEESFGAARWSLAQIADSLALETTRAFVAEEDGCVRGFILCQLAGGEAEILTFCVAPSARRKGWGAALLTRVLDKARKDGVSRVFLEVAADNATALAFYEKHGFAVIGKRPEYYAREGGSIDAVMMARELPCEMD